MTRHTFHHIIALAALLLTAVAAQGAPSLVARANAAYDKQLYNDALALYFQAERQQGTSARLCYNVGNTYYRLNNVPRAILYYERALKLDPTLRQARRNLAFVREKSQIDDPAGDSMLVTAGEAVLNLMTSNGWAVTALAAFVLALALALCYMFARRTALRKAGFFGALALVAVTAVAIVCALKQHARATGHDSAIVLVQEAPFVNAPRDGLDKKDVVFTLDNGDKVEVVDSISGKVSESKKTWYKVRNVTGREAWCDSTVIVVI